MEPTTDRRKLITAIVILLVIAGILAGVVVSAKQEDVASTSPTTSSNSATVDQPTTTTDTSSAAYKDGTYSATGGYNSPGGAEEITISVTLTDGVITETSALSGADNPEAKEHQSDFIAAYKQYVVGKSIDDVSLSRVAGASLTTRGFNNAIEQIQDQAAA